MQLSNQLTYASSNASFIGNPDRLQGLQKPGGLQQSPTLCVNGEVLPVLPGCHET